MQNVIVHFNDEQRQMVLMALAHLAVERPGWSYALSLIAAQMDNPSPSMFIEELDRHKAAIKSGVPDCDHGEVYYSVDADNYYCGKCHQGMGNAFYAVAAESNKLLKAVLDVFGAQETFRETLTQVKVKTLQIPMKQLEWPNANKRVAPRLYEGNQAEPGVLSRGGEGPQTDGMEAQAANGS